MGQINNLKEEVILKVLLCKIMRRKRNKKLSVVNQNEKNIFSKLLLIVCNFLKNNWLIFLKKLSYKSHQIILKIKRNLQCKILKT